VGPSRGYRSVPATAMQTAERDTGFAGDRSQRSMCAARARDVGPVCKLFQLHFFIFSFF